MSESEVDITADQFRDALHGETVERVTMPTDQTVRLWLENGRVIQAHYRVTYDGDWMEYQEVFDGGV